MNHRHIGSSFTDMIILTMLRKALKKHKVKYINKYGSEKKVTYRIMELTKDIKFIYE